MGLHGISRRHRTCIFPSGYPVCWFVWNCLVWQWNCRWKNRQLFCFFTGIENTLALFFWISKKARALIWNSTCCTVLQWCSIRNDVFIFDLIIFSHGKSPMGRGICPWHSASATSKLLCLGLRRRCFWSTDSEYAHDMYVQCMTHYVTSFRMI